MTTTLAQITSRAAAATAAHQLEHTTAAVHELARIYGFDASEALQKLDIAPSQHLATPEAVRLDPDVLRFAENQASAVASPPPREDVIARLLAAEDPVPSKPAPKRPKSSPKRSPKQSSPQKKQKEAEKQLLKDQKAAEKASVRAEKGALKALARSVKAAEKAAKDAPKAAEKEKKAAAKAQREALKAQKAAEKEKKAAEKAEKAAEKEKKAAEKAAKAAERAKKAPVALELEEDELAVEEFVLEGTTYLRSTAGEMFDLESHDPIGWWNEADRCIATERVC